MPRLIDLPWDSQPQEAAQPAADLNLSALFLPGQSYIDLITGIELANPIGSPTPIVGPMGPALEINSDRESLWFQPAPPSILTPRASIVWAGTLISQAANDFPTLFGTTFRSTNVGPFVGFQVKRRPSGIPNGLFLTGSFGTGSGNNWQINSSGSYETGPVVVVGTFVSGRQVLAIRSSSGVEKVFGTQTGSISYGVSPRIELGDSFNSRNGNSACAVAAMAGRAWSDAEVDSVLENVWGRLFAPRQIYIPTVAPTLPTLSLPTAADITATSFRPRVTYAY